MNSTRTIAALSGAAILAVPTAAIAHGKGGQAKRPDGPATKPSSPQAPGKPAGRIGVLSGAVSAIDPAAKTVTLAVHGGDKRTRGTARSVVVSLEGTKILAPDNDGDGTRNEIEDVRVGDHVVTVVTKKATEEAPAAATRQTTTTTAPTPPTTTTPAPAPEGDQPTLVARTLIVTTPRKTSRTLLFQGTVAKADAAAKTFSLTVKRGNRAAKEYAGQTVDFSLADAKLRVRDHDGDGTRNEIEDLEAGVRVSVKVRLAKGAEATSPLQAKQVVELARKRAKTATAHRPHKR